MPPLTNAEAMAAILYIKAGHKLFQCAYDCSPSKLPIEINQLISQYLKVKDYKIGELENMFDDYESEKV